MEQMTPEEFKQKRNSLPHRQAMKKYKINDVRFIDGSLNTLKAQIVDLEDKVAAGGDIQPGSEIHNLSKIYAAGIINAYMPPEEAAQLKNKNNPPAAETTETVEETTQEPVVEETTQEPVVEETIEENNNPEPPPAMTKEQKIAAIMDICKKNGGISISELTGFGAKIFDNTKNFKVSEDVILVRDTVNDTMFLLPEKQKPKNLAGKIALGIGLGLTALGLGFLAFGGKKK